MVYRILRIPMIVAVLVLVGCGERLFPTSNPSIRHPDGLQIVSMCYHANVTTREEVEDVAAEQCADDGSRVKFWHHDRTFNDCPIFAKARVSFICVPSK